jgi:hypothetical protein
MRKLVTVVFVPLAAALLSTSAFSEIVLHFFSVRLGAPNWVGTTFQPADTTGKLGQFFDSWTMRGDTERVSARIFPEDDKNKHLKSYWMANGFEREGRRTLAYVAERTTNKGAGVFYLERVENRPEYRGWQLSFDCTVKRVLSCPYILVADVASERERLQSPEYRAYLEKGCTELDANPLVRSCDAK